MKISPNDLEAILWIPTDPVALHRKVTLLKVLHHVMLASLAARNIPLIQDRSIGIYISIYLFVYLSNYLSTIRLCRLYC
jgi:hypothetical protein